MSTVINPSIAELWSDFIKQNPKYLGESQAVSMYFCDNEKDADECVQLVVEGIKQATSTSLWWFETNGEALPKKGDLYIITNWIGKAMAIIEVTQVEIVAFNEITEKYAEIEGEGDKSLDYWNRVHWDYYSREMKAKGTTPTQDMKIVCEQFKTIWIKKENITSS